MRRPVALLWLVLAMLPAVSLAQQPENTSRLLLTAQRLRRLRRDRERETIRWLNFERRVQSVPDSPERGFELALYYVVSGDKQRGREALDWSLSHPCETRQVSLALNWVAELATEHDKQLLEHNCPNPRVPDEFQKQRDLVFTAAVKDQHLSPVIDQAWSVLRSALARPQLLRPHSIYPLCEFLLVAQNQDKRDLRLDDPALFSTLPKELLLSLNPTEVEHPDWLAHIAAFGLIALDPNLQSSQFLQGWAMEDRQTLSEGPGVAYEFLWADPYLPGIAYQNMDPWVYDPAGRLFARANWETSSCWIAVEAGHSQQENCDGKLRVAEPAPSRVPKSDGKTFESDKFGTLSVLTLLAPCATIQERKNKDSLLIWHLRPGQQVSFEHSDQKSLSTADASGMLFLSSDVSGKICLIRPDHHPNALLK